MKNKKTSYRMMSLDLDGTLLSPILRRAKKEDCLALQNYMSSGGMPFVNTGRAPWAIRKTIERINGAGENKVSIFSCLNGSYIKDLNDGEAIETKISHEYCKKVLEIVKKYKGVNAWFYLPKGMEKHNVYIYPYNLLFKAFYPLSHLVSIKNENDLTSFKIDIFSTNKSVIAKVYYDLVDHNLGQIVTLSHSSPRLIEITARGINKGFAIKHFADKYKINRANVVALGDSFNDLSAFKSSGLSIGINPSNGNLLEHCGAVIQHKSKGVAEAIKTYILSDVNSYGIKLIFSDLDGTLIDNKTKLFSNQTKYALQQCTNHLIPIAIASGRGIYDCLGIVNAMDLNPETDIYIIGNNGATIFDIFTKQYISQTPIEPTTAKKVFDMMKELTVKEKGRMGFIIHQHSSDLLFYNPEFWKTINFKKTGFEDKYDPWADRKPVYITEYPDDIICYKFNIKFPNHERALEVNEQLRKLFPDLEVCLSSDVNVDINRKGVNKAFAAKKLAEKINVDLDYALVMGDGQNDIEALRLCKNSFVPSYAADYVKKEAKHVIETDGACHFAGQVINNYVLKREDNE